jgi:hypothetical protein
MTPDSPAELSKPVPAPQESTANPPIRLAGCGRNSRNSTPGSMRAHAARPPWLPGASADERRPPTAG